MNTLLQTTRGPFLILTPACLFLGVSAVMADGFAVNSVWLALVVLAGLCAHISVNMLNEYADFKSGLDLNTLRTPFSGGSGALPENPQLATQVLVGGILCLGICTAIGLYFVYLQGWLLAVLGGLGVLTVLTYTPWLNRHAVLCLIAPGLGFGVLMVLGSYIALTGTVSPRVILLSGVPFFLTNNLLLLNQLPDLSADKAAGRKHWIVRFGPKSAAPVYLLFAAAAYGLIVYGVVVGYWAWPSLLALLTLPLALHAFQGALKLGARIGEQPPYLAANVGVAIVTPVILAMSLLFV